jgi:hypothetical protein
MASRTGGQHKKEDWRDKFCEALSLTGNVRLSCIATGVGRSTAYDERKRNPDFAASWDSALDEATDVLEQEAARRAVHGVDEPVTSGGKLVMVDGEVTDPETGEKKTVKVPLMVRKYSDTLLIFLLKGARPQKYRDNYRPPEPLPDFDLDADVSQMTPQERDDYKLKLQQYIAKIRATGRI